MQRSPQDKDVIETSLYALMKAKELMYYSIQFTDAVQRGSILPKNFEKCLIVPEHHCFNQFLIELDWEKFPDLFKETADDASVYLINYAILLAKESYSSQLWVKEIENADLYAAQMIVKLIRDAIGHMKARSKDFAAPYWDLQNNFRRIFEIKELGVIFDARNLHEKQFQLRHFGGLTNLLKIFNYLIQDLQTRLNALKKTIL